MLIAILDLHLLPRRDLTGYFVTPPNGLLLWLILALR